MDQPDIAWLAHEFDTRDQSAAIARAEPGEPVDGTPMVTIGLTLPKDVLDEARRRAAQRGLTTGELLRERGERTARQERPRE